jgi:hypothetical protein
LSLFLLSLTACPICFIGALRVTEEENTQLGNFELWNRTAVLVAEAADYDDGS